MEKLDDGARRNLPDSLPDWTIDGEILERTFTFPDFGASIGFVTRVAILAEKANHHPDIDIRWNRVRLALTTHDAGGLTDNDVSLARAIDELG
ncbi:MAG TPA: 4a-hydroxytetrahydrobiopterin dehydratase [Acidimicrobiia bacterium]|nr:4a-hydroxytetrahydrobiopterin dehydratase [Acidimicrobiia bacterium]